MCWPPGRCRAGPTTPAGWWWNGSRCPRHGGSERWSPVSRGRAESECCGGSRRLPAGAWQRRGARPPRTAHDLQSTKICYRFHPFYGTEVEVIRHLRRIDSVILIVRLPGGTQVAVPEWMLLPQVCDRLVIEAEPRISIDALID